jgi:hypothetical protein
MSQTKARLESAHEAARRQAELDELLAQTDLERLTATSGGAQVKFYNCFVNTYGKGPNFRKSVPR